MANPQFDLVAAGCGVAGLSAALAAAEAGATVAGIERATREGAAARALTEAYLRMKSLTEVTDDSETHLAENGSGAIDPVLVEESAHSQRALAARLADR
jgi:tricarballylate dehydrogenase